MTIHIDVTVPFEMLNNDNKCNNNIMIKKLKMPFQCPLCPTIIKSKYSNYLRHIALHNPNLTKIRCEICHQTFRNASNLKIHCQRKHSSNNIVAQDIDHSFKRLKLDPNELATDDHCERVEPQVTLSTIDEEIDGKSKICIFDDDLTQTNFDLTSSGQTISQSPEGAVVEAQPKSDYRYTDSKKLATGYVSNGECLDIAHRGAETSFIVRCPTIPIVSFERLDDHCERVEPQVTPLVENEWRISYTILSVGKYIIRVCYVKHGQMFGSPLFGSQIFCIDSNKVIPVGGWEELLDEEGRLIIPATIVFDTLEAGPGELKYSVDGIVYEIDEQVDGKSKICISSDGLSPEEHDFELSWSGQTIYQSPRKAVVEVQVVTSNDVCSCERMRHGIVGKEIRYSFDTTLCGAGKLTAYCRGPNKITFGELIDRGDSTYTLSVKAEEPGMYFLTIKYGDQNVNGSPFVLKIAASSNANNVQVYGPGIEHGVLKTFEPMFICNTTGAGSGQLHLKVLGPKNVYPLHLLRKNRKVTCVFDPTEHGDYWIEVKWSEEHIPGSPFHVNISDM